MRSSVMRMFGKEVISVFLLVFRPTEAVLVPKLHQFLRSTLRLTLPHFPSLACYITKSGKRTSPSTAMRSAYEREELFSTGWLTDLRHVISSATNVNAPIVQERARATNYFLNEGLFIADRSRRIHIGTLNFYPSWIWVTRWSWDLVLGNATS